MVKETDSAADNEARRWADWFEADFSWDGLSKHTIRTGGLNGEKNLQEYWRRDPATGLSRDDAAMRDAGSCRLIWFTDGPPGRLLTARATCAAVSAVAPSAMRASRFQEFIIVFIVRAKGGNPRAGTG